MANPANEKLIEVTGLSRQYGSLHAVNNVSFDLRKGEILGFLGPNGAGKSTTMQMLCGTLAPSAGEILINGVDLLENPIAAKQQIGFLPEQPPIYPELTVDEYLLYCGKLRRIANSALTEALDTTKQRCGLQDTGSRLVGNLSKGYQQRVAIAQAIIHSPDIVVLDEPTVGLDPIQIREIRMLIKELGKDHGVILSTHILPEVQMVCNRVQIIRQGELVFNESIDDLNKRMRSGSLLLAFNKPPAADILQAIDLVEAVEMLADGRFRVHFNPDASPAETIVRMSVEQSWGLTELTPETRSLEQIFVQLTSVDAADQEQAA